MRYVTRRTALKLAYATPIVAFAMHVTAGGAGASRPTGVCPDGYFGFDAGDPVGCCNPFPGSLPGTYCCLIGVDDCEN
jgi:hypothetical protein